MRRLFLAVAAGFLTMSVLVAGTQFLLLHFLFGSAQGDIEMGLFPPAYLLANAVSALVYAVIGGCITAAIARKYEGPTILGALLLGMGLGGVLMNRGAQPMWYTATVPVLGAVVATMAGYKWLRLSGSWRQGPGSGAVAAEPNQPRPRTSK